MHVEVKENYVVKNLTSFKIGGAVEKLYFPKNQQELRNEWKRYIKYNILQEIETLNAKEETQKEKKDKTKNRYSVTTLSHIVICSFSPTCW